MVRLHVARDAGGKLNYRQAYMTEADVWRYRFGCRFSPDAVESGLNQAGCISPWPVLPFRQAGIVREPATAVATALRAVFRTAGLVARTSGGLGGDWGFNGLDADSPDSRRIGAQDGEAVALDRDGVTRLSQTAEQVEDQPSCC